MIQKMKTIVECTENIQGKIIASNLNVETLIQIKAALKMIINQVMSYIS
jgi:hypothetical protein